MARSRKTRKRAKGAAEEAEPTPLEAARSRMYRDLVFETSEKVFADEGFEGSTMQDVAAAAGISLKTLYATFPGKNEIYAEIVRMRGLGFLEAVRGAAAEGSGALESLEAGARAFVAYLIEHEPFRRILLREGRAWGLDPSVEETRDAWRAGIAHVAGILRRGMAEGVFHEDDPELLAGTVQAMLQVQLAGRIDRAKGEPDAEAIAEEILVLLRRMLCRDPEQRGDAREVA